MLITLDEFIERISKTEGSLATVENRIVVGDCLTALRYIPDSTVDLIHTSPPYNIDKAYKGEHGDKEGIDEYLDFLGLVILEMKRVLKPNASLFWQTGYTQEENGGAGEIFPIDMLSYGFFKQEPYPLVLWDRIIWRYFGGMAFKRKYTNRHETILWFVRPSEGQTKPLFDVDCIREKSRELDKRNNLWGKNPGNVWEVDRVAYGGTEQSSHIAVYPDEVAEKIIRASSKPGDLVVDPFSGSGTTTKVARSLGRRWIGIEISPEYAKESVRRLGFQQPSELQSLASAIIKAKAFGGKRGVLAVEEIAPRLRAWAQSPDIKGSRSKFDEALSKVLGAQNGRDAKPEVWEQFEQVVAAGDGDPVVEADSLLSLDYKQRKNQNGVFRYGTALDLIEALVGRMNESKDAELTSFIEELAANEPSSYRLARGTMQLAAVDKRLKPLARGNGINRTVPPPSESPPLDLQSEAYQPTLLPRE